MKRLVFALVVGVSYFSALAVSGLEAGGGGGGCHEPLSKGSGSRVEISSSCFKTTVLNVDKGAHVEWVNKDAYQHNVVFTGVGWSDWRPLQQGQTISYAFVSEGVFPYFCAFHPSMVGAVVVGDGLSAQIAGDATQPGSRGEFV